MNPGMYPYIIVGAGFWGSVIAERIASVRGEKVLVIDRRNHTGGNSHSFVDNGTGIECHAYGTHIFHTRKHRVWEYLSGFTRFNYYRHKVLTEYRGRAYPMPISLATINAFYGLGLKPEEARAFIAGEAAKAGITAPANLEEKAVSLIGRPLYEAFIKGYTLKQWQRDPRDLPAAIIDRLPVRTNYNPEYFDDPWQGQPESGFHGLFDALLSHPNITVSLGTDYADIRDVLSSGSTVFYSGALDEFFGYSLGMLNWRSLRFERETLPVPDFQGAAVINQADESVPYTRTHEFRHLHPERGHPDAATVIVREYPMAFSKGDIPYYPVNTASDTALLSRYKDLARQTAPDMVFGGRLGSYRYMDMDTTIDDALETFDRVLG